MSFALFMVPTWYSLPCWCCLSLVSILSFYLCLNISTDRIKSFLLRLLTFRMYSGKENRFHLSTRQWQTHTEGRKTEVHPPKSWNSWAILCCGGYNDNKKIWCLLLVSGVANCYCHFMIINQFPCEYTLSCYIISHSILSRVFSSLSACFIVSFSS